MPAPGRLPRNPPARCGFGSNTQHGSAWRRNPEFRSRPFFGRFSISGVTRDGSGAALGSCVVQLFESATSRLVDTTTSDGAGAFSFSIGQNAGFFFMVAYKPGSPDVAGTSANTLAAVEIR